MKTRLSNGVHYPYTAPWRKADRGYSAVGTEPADLPPSGGGAGNWNSILSYHRHTLEHASNMLCGP